MSTVLSIHRASASPTERSIPPQGRMSVPLVSCRPKASGDACSFAAVSIPMETLPIFGTTFAGGRSGSFRKTVSRPKGLPPRMAKPTHGWGECGNGESSNQLLIPTRLRSRFLSQSSLGHRETRGSLALCSLAPSEAQIICESK